MNKLILTLPVALMMTACASSGPKYMAADDAGDYGYYESVLEKNRYRVAYKARGQNLETSRDYALLRSAELTLEKGYDWFQIVDRNTNTEERDSHSYAVANMRVAAATYRECGVLTCRTVTRPVYVDEAYVDSMRRPDPQSTVTFMEIIMGEGARPSGGDFYDAATLAKTIRARINT
ncbi:CC0125/CC1285 family lipoprotein [Kordiimonas pumila]|uniref:DUF4136 domain-containing protein n=1 Tax=Kordiimonas pumila TaxID=2161677 RepID=A0ABV7D2V7_9PROT|nr:hypothetical protein [Kordiimonas pumila]